MLLPVLLAAWLQTERDLRPRWWLIPLVWVWSLCHGFWFLGAGLGCLVALGIALSRRADGRTLTRLGAVAAGSFAVVALNPVGLGVLEAPFAVRSTARFIAEWERTDLLAWGPLGALLMIAVTAAVWAVTRRGVTWSRVLLLVVATVLVWYSARLVVVGALVAAPLFAAALEGLGSRSAGDTEPLPAREGVGGDRGLGRALHPRGRRRGPAGGGPARRRADRARRGARPPAAGDRGAQRLRARRLARLAPSAPRAVRRRPDHAVLRRARRGLRPGGPPGTGWYAVVRDADLRVALVAEDSALAAGLTERGWVPEGTDDGYVLLRRPA